MSTIGRGWGGGGIHGSMCGPGSQGKSLFSQVFQMWVVAPHSDKDLLHILQVSLHSTLLHLPMVHCQCAHSNPVQKYLQLSNGVADSIEVG